MRHRGIRVARITATRRRAAAFLSASMGRRGRFGADDRVLRHSDCRRSRGEGPEQPRIVSR